MRQVRQMRGRFKFTKLPQISKLSRFSLSFDRGKCGRCGRFFKNFSAHKNIRLTNIDTDRLNYEHPVESRPCPDTGVNKSR